jgi:hypothetical protein
MKAASTAIIALSLLFGLKSQGASREVSFDCGDLLSGPPDRPLVALDALLDQNPNVRRFHLKWDAFGTLGGNDCWVFYDRKSQILRLKAVGDYIADGNDDSRPTQKRSAYVTAWRFSGVSRSRLHLLMHFYADKPNADGSNQAFLTQLLRFGCSMKITQDSQRGYYPKP